MEHACHPQGKAEGNVNFHFFIGIKHTLILGLDAHVLHDYPALTQLLK